MWIAWRAGSPGDSLDPLVRRSASEPCIVLVPAVIIIVVTTLSVSLVGDWLDMTLR
ncbi:ABC-type dipeptide/oligopeptide/nickel transport system permease subunit [Rhizobium sp. BK529]|uniref:hypothetical protein n=1 Tax=unclassified Rhizobium TaxID=2613769 RepID=UPI001404F4F6|nr:MULTISPECIES: hypothetical protein [unclassified Rhizobium]MBB3591319.1 ABC-type dipeptide/oligopeptide/nickel transport system permease subunit [Rhizobium sp. BK529]